MHFRHMCAETLLALSVVCAVGAVFLAVRPHDVTYKWDAAEHAWFAGRLAVHLRALDLVAFIRDSSDTGVWPFMHPWMMGITMAVFCIQEKTAAWFTLIHFAGCMVVVFLLALKASSGQGHWPGFFAAALFASAAFVVDYAALPMLEIPCIFWMLLGIYLFMWGKHTSAGIAATIVFFIKFNYGGLLLLALIVADSLLPGTIQDRLKRWWRMCSPLALAIAVWFAWDFPQHILFLRYSTVPRVSGIPFFSLRNATLYPEILWRSYYPVLPVAILVPVAALAGVWKANRDLRILQVITLLLYVLIVVHPLKDGRFIMPVVPLLVLCASLGLRQTFPRIITSPVVLGCVSLLIACQAIHTYTGIQNRSQWHVADPPAREAVRYIAQTMRECAAKQAVVVGAFDEVSPGGVRWELLKNGYGPDVNVTHVMPHVQAGHAHDSEMPMHQRYRDAFNAWLHEKQEIDLIVGVRLTDERSRYLTDDYRNYCAWRVHYVTLAEQHPSLERCGEWKGDNGLHVQVFRRRVNSA